jgi:GntR family transcriptional regulator/MocR family aminotransferase
LPLDLTSSEPSGSAARFLRIANAITLAIARGRLTAGERLPSSRDLAQQLGVHRNTVLAAYRELLAEDWIRCERGRGTFVSRSLPHSPRAQSRRGRPREAPAFDLRGAAPPAVPAALEPGMQYLYGGLPDLGLLPGAALSRAYRRALQRPGDVLAYGDPRGHVSLRTALATMLRTARGLELDENGIVVTRGSQMALALSARALFRPGDIVAVESLGYPPAWQALKSAGARLVPVAVDRDGIDVGALGKVCERKAVRGVYVTPHHQYPTTVTLSAARRMALLELAKTRRLSILEDDYDHEFHYEGQPVLPLAARDDHGLVVYVGTLSKVLAPGLRIGYVVAAPELLERIVAQRYYLDRQGDLASERAVAELIEDGEMSRHLRRARRVYLERRDSCVSELRQRFAQRLSFRVPKGGMSLWLQVHGTSVERWLERCTKRGVAFQVGGQFTWQQRSVPYVRLGYGALPPDAMSRALEVLWQEFRA